MRPMGDLYKYALPILYLRITTRSNFSFYLLYRLFPTPSLPSPAAGMAGGEAHGQKSDPHVALLGFKTVAPIA